MLLPPFSCGEETCSMQPVQTSCCCCVYDMAADQTLIMSKPCAMD